MDRDVCSIVKEAVIKTIARKEKCKKAKWLSEEALHIAEKRKEAKRKGEKGRYTHLKAEFQRIARRDKKAFLSDQCKEIEENNRMGGASFIAQSVKNLPAKQESWLGFLSQEDPLEKEMATHSSILAWRITWTEEPGGLQSMGSQESDTTEQLERERERENTMGRLEISSRKLEIPREHFMQRWTE